jgi:diacylglycerol kinase family enzyme
MHVALVHNVTAGDRKFEPEDLVGLLGRAGHEVSEFGMRKRDVARAIALYPDALAVAGGDGTVAKAAAALRGSNIPLVILPTGKANNIAQSLAVTGQVAAIIRNLATARHAPLDIGSASGSWGEKSFVEAAGLGVIADMLRGGRSPRARLRRFVKTVGRSSESEVRGAARGVGRLITRQVARYYEVRADGNDLSGEYLAVAAMNIRQIGPRLLLAPDANPSDGLLDLVLVTPDARDALVHYVSSPDMTVEHVPVVSRRVRTAEISWPADDGHLDDKPWPRAREERKKDESALVQVRVEGQITVLVPSTVAESRATGW